MRPCAACLIGVLLGALPPAAWAQAGGARTEATVVVDGVVRTVPVMERQGRRFVALREVAGALGGRIESTETERAVVIVDGERLVVHRRSPFVTFGGRAYQMPDAAQRDASGFWLPAVALDRLLPRLWPDRVGERAAPETAEPLAEPQPERAPDPLPEGAIESGRIGRSTPGPDLPGGQPPVGDLERIDVWSGPDRTRLGFLLARPADVAVDATLPRTIQIDMGGVSVPPGAVAGLTALGLVDSASVAMEGSRSVLTLWVAERATMYAVAPLRRPTGVEIVLHAAPVEETPVRLASHETDGGRGPRTEPGPWSRADPAAASPRADGPRSARRTETWTVVIDPGHGGRDPGAKGPRGTPEKDVVLKIALDLAEVLESRGIRALLTREDDTFVPLAERTRFANRRNADLFVSIHANAATRSSAEGFETYFLSAARTEDARRVARMENAAIRYENPAIDPESLDDLNFILWDLAQNEYLRESSALAEILQEDLGRRLPHPSRGVKQAPFAVLNGAFMPAVLFESGFISNPREESLLNDPRFRTRLVEGLAESIVTYFDQYGRKVVPDRAAR